MQVAVILYTADSASEVEAQVSAVQVSDQPLGLNRILKNYVGSRGCGFNVPRCANRLLLRP